jgi:hypothetical protein
MVREDTNQGGGEVKILIITVMMVINFLNIKFTCLVFSLFSIMITQKDICNCKNYLNKVDINNLRQGIWKKCYNNGKIAIVANFKNDTLQGEYTKFYKNGNLQERTYFKDGFRDSILIYYYESGNIRSIINIKNKFRTESIVLNENGNITNKYIYKDSFLFMDILYYKNNIDTGLIINPKFPKALEYFKSDILHD